MRKKCFRTLFSLLLLISLYHPSSAQNCYTVYKTQGDKYKALADLSNQGDTYRRQNYTLARQQYQTAKNCSYLTNAQRIEIDRLLAAMNDKLKAPARVILPSIKRV